MIHSGGLGATFLVTVLALGYEWLAMRAARNGRCWSRRRTAVFLTGCLLLILASVPAAHADFLDHTAQHLLVGMYAPLALVLGAPVTLVLRNLPSVGARAVGRILHVRAVRVLGHPITVLGLNLGGLAVLYLTPLYATSRRSTPRPSPIPACTAPSSCISWWPVTSSPGSSPDPTRRPGGLPCPSGLSYWVSLSSPTRCSPSFSTPASSWTCPRPPPDDRPARHSCTTAATSPSCCWRSRFSAPGDHCARVSPGPRPRHRRPRHRPASPHRSRLILDFAGIRFAGTGERLWETAGRLGGG